MNVFDYKKIGIDLPSGFKYEGLSSIEVRGFVFSEIRSLSETNFDNWTLNDTIEYYTKSGVIRLLDIDGNTMKLDILDENDLYMLMYFVNILSNDSYKLVYSTICGGCKNNTNLEVTIDSIDLEVGDYRPSIPFRTATGVPSTLKRLNLGKMIKLNEYINSPKFNNFNESDIKNAMMLDFEIEDDQLNEFIETSEVNYTSSERSLLKSLLFIGNLNVNDMNKIADLKKSQLVRIKPIEYKCSSCGTIGHGVIKLSIKDLLPENAVKDYFRFRTFS